MGYRRDSKLKRKKAVRNPKRLIHIFCEGNNTEPGYFQEVSKKYRNVLVDIRILKGQGVPATIAERAADRARSVTRLKKRKNSFELSDQVWAVFDRDDHPNIDEALQRCRDNNVQLAYSNPCFEHWLVVHFEDFDQKVTRLEIQRHLQKLSADYNPKGRKLLDFGRMLSNISKAEERAERQLKKREHEGAPLGIPCTTVGKLTAALRRASEEASA